MSGFALRVKTKSGQQIVNSLTKNSTIKELKKVLSDLSNIPINRLNVLSGFPPRTLDLTGDNDHLCNSGIASGDTLILEEKIVPIQEHPNNNKLPEQTAENAYVLPGLLMKYIVPADNSCLFSSVFFVLNGKTDDSGAAMPHMRVLVSDTINQERDTYCEAVLGKPVEEYCSWIKEETSWGGAIELSVLSNYYGMEIVVVDTLNGILNRFGEDQNYGSRVFLMFDGIHYDPLYLEPSEGGKIKTIFLSEDEAVLSQAKQLALEAKSSKQFTDVEKFTLKCMVCNILLKGQLAASEHAEQTGHVAYGEV